MMALRLLLCLLLLAYAAFEEANLASYEDCFSQCTLHDLATICDHVCRLFGFLPSNSP